MSKLTVYGYRLFAAAAMLLASGMPVAAQPEPAEPQEIQLVAVQMTLDLADFWSYESFEAKIREQMDAATADLNPELETLIVFPEDVGLMLVVQGMESRLAGIESIEEAISTAVSSHALALAWTRLIRWKSWVPALFLNKNRLIAETYFGVFSDMASEYGVHIVAGSVVLPPYRITDGVVEWERGPSSHNVHNTSYLFGPDGLVIGKQDKVELIELELDGALNLKPGSIADLQVFDTPLGRIGIAICLDAFDDAIVARLTELDAQILVQPSANPGEWSEWQQTDWLRSSHQRVAVEQQFAYAINPMLNGPLWDIDFYGQSGIVAADGSAAEPGYSLLEPTGGFLSVATSDTSEEVLSVTVIHPDHLD